MIRLQLDQSFSYRHARQVSFSPVTSVPLGDGMDLVAETKICDFPQRGVRENRSQYATLYSREPRTMRWSVSVGVNERERA